MTCQELIEFLTEYLDGQLPMTQRVAFDFHLALCRDCRSYLHNFKTTIQLSKQACGIPPQEISENIPDDLVKAILNSRREIQN